MKKHLFIIFSSILLVFTSCTNTNNSRTIVNDTTKVEGIALTTGDVFKDWLDGFQKEHPTWALDDAGRKLFKKEFSKKMTSDLIFATSLCTSNSVRIIDNESIATYNNSPEDYGSLYIHEMTMDINLIKPLYDGSNKTSIYFRIASLIPATRSHEKPFLGGANICEDITKSSPEPTRVLLLPYYVGTYFIGKKAE